jgi:formylglycine-generating enzyme required for sulfatase activity
MEIIIVLLIGFTFPLEADDSNPVPNATSGARTAENAPSGGSDEIVNSIGMPLKLIHPGTFIMGSSETEKSAGNMETPVHEVTLTEPFYLGEYEVTQEQWTAVMGDNPSKFTGQKHPVERVTWEDAQAFLKKLSEKEHTTYRLPTEAEWEYACRAGVQTAYYWGETWKDEYGWCAYDGDGATHDIGQKQPNAWGLYDMSGNVWEWCQDRYDAHLSGQKTTNPHGPDSGSNRVVRGGSWNNYPLYCISSYRNAFAPSSRFDFLGIRVARTP